MKQTAKILELQGKELKTVERVRAAPSIPAFARRQRRQTFPLKD